MNYRRPKNSRMNCWKNVWISMAITKTQSFQVYGHTKHNQSHSRLWLTTLGAKYVGEEHAEHLMSCLKKILQYHAQMEGGEIYRHDAWLGLQTKTSSPVHAWICEKDITAIQSPLFNKTTGFVLPIRANKIRSQNIVCKDSCWHSLGWRSG